MYDKSGSSTAQVLGNIVKMKPFKDDQGRVQSVDVTIINTREHKNNEYKNFTTVRVMNPKRAQYYVDTFNPGDQVFVQGVTMTGSYQHKEYPIQITFSYMVVNEIHLSRGASKKTQEIFKQRRAEYEANNQPIGQDIPPQAELDQQAAAQQQAKPQPQYNEPPMDFDDDIPF